MRDRKLIRSVLMVGLLILVVLFIYVTSSQPNAPVNPRTSPTTPATTGTTGVSPSSQPSATLELSPTPTLASTLTPTPTPAFTPAPTETSTIQAIQPPAIPGVQDMHVVLNETFTDPNLNTGVWNTQFKWGDINPPELEQYLPDMLKIQSGILSLTAQKTLDGKMPYSSGMIASNDRFYFQYGYVEIRARVPAGRGLWPAFWLLSQPKGADEIDVMEILGQDPTTVYTTLHYKMANQQEAKQANSFHGTDYSQDYHTFGVDWEWNKITWYIDGNEVFQVTDHVPHVPMYLIADLAVGGAWAGPPDASTGFPATFDIAYIHVFMH